MTESASTTTTTTKNTVFHKDAHIRYFVSALHGLPRNYVALDTNRLTLIHFAVQALDFLDVWDTPTVLEEYQLSKDRIIDYIYNCLQLPNASGGGGGFQGGTFVGPASNPATVCFSDPPTAEVLIYHRGHIAMTYCALLILIAVGDDLSQLLRQNEEGTIQLIDHIRQLQRPDGSFGCTVDPSDHDLRFLYCACVICYLLQDWSGMDQDQAVNYIQSCRSYDGGIALLPGQEGHGGSTFCGLAALTLMGRLDEVVLGSGWKEELIHWCVHRQVAGMQGRPNKAQDTCYSYWIGGSLRLLMRSSEYDDNNNNDDLLDRPLLVDFVMRCQSSQMGGFSKIPNSYPDLLHSYYSMAWLCLANDSGGLEHIVDEQDHDHDGPSLSTVLLPLPHRLNCTLGIRQDRVDAYFAKQRPADPEQGR